MTSQDLICDAVRAAADEYDADVFFYSGSIDDDGFGQLTKAVAEGKNRKNAVLILVTNGGLANPAYQIARLFQRQYETFYVFCPSRCKSAGTLVALGANHLLMDGFSELGPLDVQLVKQNEIASRKSGLLAQSSFDALADSSFELYERLMVNITLRSRGNVSFKLASELSASMASAMMAPVYAQINPDVVGSENRDLQIAFEYGRRLVEFCGNASPEAVFALVHNYPAHDFIIDDDEARTLFNRVDYPSENLYRLIPFLGEAAYDEAKVTQAGALTRLIDVTKEDDHDRDEDGEAVAVADEPAEPVAGSGQADRPSDPAAPTPIRDGDSAADDTRYDKDAANDGHEDISRLRVLDTRRPR